MQEPFQSSSADPAPQRPARQAGGEELVATRDPAALVAEAEQALAGKGPLNEIATAFRMNAEALHTLKQMQADLADSVRRGDRSQLVIQSTQALNDTFRNLSAVQRELLSRLEGSRPGASAPRSPVVPLLLLGLLVVLLGGIYVVLEAVDRTGSPGVQAPPVDIANQVMESWSKGRTEGAEHAEAELRRLNARIEEERARGRRLEQQLDTRGEELGSLERARRSAELERDTFASQIQQARAEVIAKKALEEEVLSLSARTDSANRILKEMQADLDQQRRTNAFLRERLADYGMGFTEDDAPWRPGLPHGAPDPDAPGTITPLPPSQEKEKQRLELLIAGKKKMGMQTADLERKLAALTASRRAPLPTAAEAPAGDPEQGPVSGSAGEGAGPATPVAPPPGADLGWARSAVPPPAAVTSDEIEKAANRMGPPPPVVPLPRPAMAAPTKAPTTAPTTAPSRTPAASMPPAQPRPAAYGGDTPNALPPPVLRKRGSLQTEKAGVARVRTLLNELLDTNGGRAGWQVTRLEGVGADRLGGVVLMRYDGSGQPVERMEAEDVRILVDRSRKSVAFDLRDGAVVAGNQKTPLPATGTRIVVAEGADAARWSTAPLTLIQRR